MLGETRNKARGPSPTLGFAKLDIAVESKKYGNTFCPFSQVWNNRRQEIY
jgi:hypothetical protein